MTSKAKYLLFGTALLAFSGYSAAGTSNEQSTVTSGSDVMIVTGSYSTDREIRAAVIERIGRSQRS